MMVALIALGGLMSEKGKYRQFTVEQKSEIVLAGLRGDRSVRDVCRAYEISETLYYSWRDKLLEGRRGPCCGCLLARALPADQPAPTERGSGPRQTG